MSSFRPFTGKLSFTYAGRTVTLSRKDGAWYVEEAGGSANRECLASDVIGALGAPRSPETVVAVKGEGGVVGRIRDGGGPRESYVVDCDAPNEKWGAITDTMDSALTELLEHLASEDPPDSAW